MVMQHSHNCSIKPVDLKHFVAKKHPKKATRLSVPDLSYRIIRLEMAVAHLEHELEQMHSVLLAVQAELKTTRDQMLKLERRLVLATEIDEQREPIDERPPHY